MGLINTDSSYHFIDKVDFSKPDNIRLSIKDYQTKGTRANPGKYDPVFQNHIGIIVSSADQAALYEIFYRNLKSQPGYLDMVDDV